MRQNSIWREKEKGKWIKMDVLQLCERIGIQPEVKLRIEKILSETDLAFLEDIRQDFFEYEK